MRFCLGHLFHSSAISRKNIDCLPRSYDWQGNAIAWQPSFVSEKYALDIERLDTPLPDTLVPSCMEPVGFLAAWTRAEAIAKLCGIPIIIYIKKQPLVKPVMEEIVNNSEYAHAPCVTYSGLWPEKQIVFTCAWSNT